MSVNSVYRHQQTVPVLVDRHYQPPPVPPPPLVLDDGNHLPAAAPPPRPPLPQEAVMVGPPPRPPMPDTDDEEGLFTTEPGSNRSRK